MSGYRTLQCVVQLMCWSVLLLCWTVVWNGGGVVATPTEHDYFDRIRSGDGPVIQSVEFSPDLESTSSVARIQLAKNHTDVNNNQTETETIRLVDVASFLPFGRGEDRMTIADAAVLLLGIHHFNHKELSPVLAEASPALQQCNIRLTTELFDTESDEVRGTALLNSLLEERPRHNLTLPRPAAVVGSYRSKISSPQTILGSINDLLQISPASTSANLDDQEVYPLFARTCPSSDGEASAILDYFLKLGVSRVGILFLSDAFGSALQRNFEEQARALGMETRYAGFVDLDGIPRAIQTIKESQFQHVFVVALDMAHYETIMEEAYKAGIANGKHAWLFYGVSQWTIQDKAAYPADSVLFKASQGVAIVNFGAVPQTQIQHPGQRQQDPVPAELKTPNEKFRALWHGVHEDEAFLSYLSNKLPSGVTLLESDVDDIFHDVVSVWAYFLYDAVTSVGTAMCATGNEFFSGTDLIQQFSAIAFEGISGRVEYNEANTRKHETIRFTVWNMLPVNEEQADDDGLHRFIMSPTSLYSNGKWNDIRGFVFADGSTIPPEDLVNVQSNTDTINEPIRWVGITLSVAIMSGAVFCLAWTLVFRRKEQVVKSSQPSFLGLIAFGSLLQAMSLIPLSLDHSTDTSNDDQFENACMIVPWLYYAGLSITCAALFAKTHRLFEILRIPDISHLLVERRDFLFWTSFVLGMNSAVLVLWTSLDPLRYEIVVDGATDIFGRPVLSQGKCRSENNDPNGFWLALLLWNVCTLLVANFMTYKTRLIKTEYKESQYIAFALATVSEALVIGGAMLHATQDEPDANYVVQTGSVFLTSFVTASLVFAPKFIALRSDVYMRGKRTATRTQNRAAGAQHDDSDDEHSSSENLRYESGDVCPEERRSEATNEAATVDRGIAILHHPNSVQPETIIPFGSSNRFGSRALLNVEYNSGGSTRVRYEGDSRA